jgi:chemotaxis protein MotB
MLRRVPLFISSCCLLSLFGCIGQNTYQKKIEEASDLTRDLAEVRRKNVDLSRENEELRAKIDGLDRKIGELETGKKDIENLLVKKQDAPTLTIAEQGREIERLRGDLANLQREREGKVRDVSVLYESLLERMKDEVAHGRVSISELRGKMTVSLPDEVLFDPGSDEVKPGGVTVIRKIAELLTGVRDREVRVEASFGITGDRESAGKRRPAWESAASRAVATAELFRRLGVEPAAINAGISGGFATDKASGAAPVRAKDRRIGIIIVSKE